MGGHAIYYFLNFWLQYLKWKEVWNSHYCYLIASLVSSSWNIWIYAIYIDINLLHIGTIICFCFFFNWLVWIWSQVSQDRKRNRFCQSWASSFGILYQWSCAIPTSTLHKQQHLAQCFSHIYLNTSTRLAEPLAVLASRANFKEFYRRWRPLCCALCGHQTVLNLGVCTYLFDPVIRAHARPQSHCHVWGGDREACAQVTRLILSHREHAPLGFHE